MVFAIGHSIGVHTDVFLTYDGFTVSGNDLPADSVKDESPNSWWRRPGWGQDIHRPQTNDECLVEATSARVIQ